MNLVGIMIGRLSSATDNRIQFFPNDWEKEFPLAKELGFDFIQWFLDRDIPNFDPINDIWRDPDVLKKIDYVRKILPISSVDCGFYFMFGPKANISFEYFSSLLKPLSSRLSEGILSIPLLEKSAPHSEKEKKEALITLQKIADKAKPLGLRLALETEMPATELIKFIESCDRENIGVSYDTGNCTSYGFNCPHDIRLLDKMIFEVHLKDRKVGSTQSVLLGKGDTDFINCFQAFKDIDYQGTYTLQAWRGEDFIFDSKNQLDFIKNILNKK